MAKTKVKKPANSIQLSNKRPQDIKAIENLQALQKVLPACSDITATARFLCEKVAPQITEKYAALKIA